MALKQLATVDEVIDALGGNSGTMSVTGAKSPQAVSNWRRRKRIPPRHYSCMADALAAGNFAAPRQLWGMTPPDPLSA